MTLSCNVNHIKGSKAEQLCPVHGLRRKRPKGGKRSGHLILVHSDNRATDQTPIPIPDDKLAQAVARLRASASVPSRSQLMEKARTTDSGEVLREIQEAFMGMVHTYSPTPGEEVTCAMEVSKRHAHGAYSVPELNDMASSNLQKVLADGEDARIKVIHRAIHKWIITAAARQDWDNLAYLRERHAMSETISSLRPSILPYFMRSSEIYRVRP